MVITLDRQFPDLPKRVRFCRNCVVSNQKPRLRFDERGICAACEWAWIKDNRIDWEAREKELQALCDRHRSRTGDYDVIVPGSGGKDSGFVAHVLKERYGMHPLCVTWAPFEHTDIGWRNLQYFVRSGFDNVMAMPKGTLHRKFCRLAYELVGDPFLPFIYGQKAFAYHTALKHGVKLMFYGENGEVEYGGSEKYRYRPSEGIEDWEAQYFKGASINALVDAGSRQGALAPGEVTPNDLWWYKPPAPGDIAASGLEMHWMSYYVKWIPQENFYYSATHTGFRPNDCGRSESTYSRYASLDDKVDGFHYYLSYIKFGIGRATRDAMTDIYRGHITRDEAVTLVRRFDGEFPERHYAHFKEYTGIDDDLFWSVIDRYRELSNVWSKIDGKWTLTAQVS